ncbi:tetratricopeptide repeat protein [Sunxiuqinia dokdonensis]|uniref:Uncharacterized protein n=1 Tax=Sunxiuqinia dokdonensis TaxID=1409788 RepID=A0A0L8VAH8_9BACT|nr:tetratricopeptide repeat protein [Sunxiuqinia dokdonensis]KOH45172.1 hypothetical protein NC99_20340 [Sunxiuqinia dokdonensis]
MTEELNDIKKQVQANQLQEAAQQIDHLLQQQPDFAELHFIQGQIFFKQQQWGRAINAYNRVLELEPNHPNAQSQIDMANSILGYFTPDMFNP